MNVRPLRDRVLAKRVEDLPTTTGGLYIPDRAKEKPLEAIVIAIGSGRVLDSGVTVPLELQVGDRVLIGKHSGSDVKLQGTDYIILREDELLAVLES